MSPDLIVDLLRETFKVAFLLAAPVLGVALIIGLCISVFQAVTSIQEQTLVFVPKIVGVILSLILFMSWMLSIIISFTLSIFESIPEFIR